MRRAEIYEVEVLADELLAIAGRLSVSISVETHGILSMFHWLVPFSCV